MPPERRLCSAKVKCEAIKLVGQPRASKAATVFDAWLEGDNTGGFGKSTLAKAVCHDLEVLARYSDRVVVVYRRRRQPDGKVIALCTTGATRTSSKAHRSRCLDRPMEESTLHPAVPGGAG